MAAPSTPPDAALPRRLLDLNAECLLAIFALAQREADEAHVAAYRVRAPRRMPLVCRALRELVAAPRKRVLLVPLLLADGATPTFTTEEAWDAYLGAVRASVRRYDDELSLVSSPAGPYDVDAHLEAFGVAHDDDFVFANANDAYTTNLFDEAHVRHAPCLWSLVRCSDALERCMLAFRVTAIELRLWLPLTAVTAAVDEESSMVHFVSAWADRARDVLANDTPGLRSLTVCVASNDAGAFTGAEALVAAQNNFFTQAWYPFASGLAVRPPLERLRFALEPPLAQRAVVDGDNATTFDDYILNFLLRACASPDSIRPYHNRSTLLGTSWNIAFTSMEPLAFVPLRVRCVQLMHAGAWDEPCTLHLLALLGVERLELLGDQPFSPFTDMLEAADFQNAASVRRKPAMTLRCREPPYGWCPPWLTVERAPRE